MSELEINVEDHLKYFKEHEIKEIRENEWWFGKPGTITYGATIIVRPNKLIITGDLGYWIFCMYAKTEDMVLAFMRGETKSNRKILDFRAIDYFSEKVASRDKQLNPELTRDSIKDTIEDLVEERFKESIEGVIYESELLEIIKDVNDKSVSKLLKKINDPDKCFVIEDEYGNIKEMKQSLLKIVEAQEFYVYDIWHSIENINDKLKEYGFPLLDYENLESSHPRQLLALWVFVKAFMRKKDNFHF